MSETRIGVIGLGVMGANLARNIESRGNTVAVYNRTWSVTEEFMQQNDDLRLVACRDLSALIEATTSPRQIFLMIKAGGAVDRVIEDLLPLLSPGDIILDGGNSYFTDTVRREQICLEQKILFMGLGISGGEEGALHGPSLMPGGPKEAWEVTAPLLESIAAQADGPCVAYLGPGGSGHFVKMVHNGIEYGDMQLIAEVYDLLKRRVEFTPQQFKELFNGWNEGALASYLIEITAQIFGKKDELSDEYLIDQILDKAGQKGTGRWTAQVALDIGVPVPTLTAAVDARILSSYKELRGTFSERRPDSSTPSEVSELVASDQLIPIVEQALLCAKVLCFAQGMHLLRVASKEYQWDLPLSKVAGLWKGGCIIRARLLDDIETAFSSEPDLEHLLLDSVVGKVVLETLPSLRTFVNIAVLSGIPVLAHASALNYFESLCAVRLPQNLTQAQRDCFGAHTFERVDREGSFHSDW